MKRNVYIDPKCLSTSLVASAIEIYNREVSGYLIGSNGSAAKRLSVVSAYPIQTDKKCPTWVEHANKAAVDRVESFISTLNMNLVGGFHSHPTGPNRLTTSDIKFISEKAEEQALKEWLELIINVKKRDYTSAQKPGVTYRKYANKLGMTVRTDSKTGYDITLSGFWLKRNGDPNMKIAQEANLRTSWKRLSG